MQMVARRLSLRMVFSVDRQLGGFEDWVRNRISDWAMIADSKETLQRWIAEHKSYNRAYG